MDGGNFSRLPTATLFGLTEKTYDAAFLQAVTADLAAKTNAARANVAEDADGYMTLSASKSATLRAADDCYKPLQTRYPFLVSGVWRVKSVALSHLWSYTGYTGVYCPWLSEVIINTDTPVSLSLIHILSSPRPARIPIPRSRQRSGRSRDRATAARTSRSCACSTT